MRRTKRITIRILESYTRQQLMEVLPGDNNSNCNIPDSFLENPLDFIARLQEENLMLKQEIVTLKQALDASNNMQ